MSGHFDMAGCWRKAQSIDRAWFVGFVSIGFVVLAFALLKFTAATGDSFSPLMVYLLFFLQCQCWP